MCVICSSVIGTGERACTSDGAGNAGSAEKLSRGECVCACVYGCVGMYVHMCVCGHALAKRQYPYIRTYESQFTGVLERSSVCIES